MTPKIDDVVKYKLRSGEVKDARVRRVGDDGIDLDVRDHGLVVKAHRGDAAECWFFGERRTPPPDEGPAALRKGESVARPEGA